MALRILVSNDDGIAAHGLKVLEAIARALSDDVWVVAPETEQSGVAHSLTLHQPVRVRQLDERHYAVNGTPTDCVLLALQKVIPVKEKPVDLLLSGVNYGSNVGDDVTYSGTVAAAMEGTILDVPSIALSQLPDKGNVMHWQAVEKCAPDIIRALVKTGWPKGTLININFPACGAQEIRGTRLCAQGKRLVNVALTERIDPKGRPYFWIGGPRDDKAVTSGVDIDLLGEGYITVTPLYLDLTDYRALETLQQAI